MVKEAIIQLVPQFSTSRMVLEYAHRFYVPAAENGNRLTYAGARRAGDLASWRENVLRSWPLVHLCNQRRTLPGRVYVKVFLAGIDPADIACWDNNGNLRKSHVSKINSPGVYTFEIDAKGIGRKEILRLFPTHPALISPQELGLAIEILE